MRNLYAKVQAKGTVLFPVEIRRARVELPERKDCDDAEEDGGDDGADDVLHAPDDDEDDGAGDPPAEADADEWAAPEPGREAAEEKVLGLRNAFLMLPMVAGEGRGGLGRMLGPMFGEITNRGTGFTQGVTARATRAILFTRPPSAWLG